MEETKEHNEPGSELNERQKKFCENFVFDWNQTRSYMAAYPESTYAAAGVSAHELLKFPKIQAYIEYLKTKTAELAGISPLMVAMEYKKMAFTSAADLRDGWYTEKEWEELTSEQKAMISEIETTEREILGNGEDPVIIEKKFRVKTYNKQVALAELKKMFGYDSAEKHEVTHINPLKVSDDLE